MNSDAVMTNDQKWGTFLWSVGVICALALALNSYPMMHPGFDVWYHLATIDQPPPPGHQAYRHPFWYAVWHNIFEWTNITGTFERALIVHRTQFALSGLLMYWASRMALKVVFHDQPKNAVSISLISVCSVVIWFIMLGTVSMVPVLGVESTIQQAWILWYSINYQISLPFYFLGTSLLLDVITGQNSQKWRVLKGLASLTMLVLVTVVHAAEMVYFLYCTVLLGLVFLRGSKSLWVIATGMLLIGMLVLVTLQQSYRMPEIISLSLAGDFTELVRKLQHYGQTQIEGGINREKFGWNQLMSLSVILGLGVVVVAYRNKRILNFQAVLFLLLTSLIALAPLFRYSAAVASMISYEYIVNRYYYASYLFLMLPLFVAVVLNGKPSSRKNVIYVVAVAIPVLVLLVYSRSYDENHVLYRNAKSIVSSVKPEKVMFGLSLESKTLIETNLQRIDSEYKGKSIMLCTDIYTAHYLQHVYKNKNVLYDGGVNYDLLACQKKAAEQNKTVVIFPSAQIKKPNGELAIVPKQ